MTIVTGIFDAPNTTEDAVRALTAAGFHPADISVAIHDKHKGERLAVHLGREYRWPSGDEITADDAVFDRLPVPFLEAIRHSELGDEGANWYRDRFTEGRYLVIVNAGARADDAMRIIRAQHGIQFHEHRERPPRQPDVMAGPRRGPVVPGTDIYVERRRLPRPMSPEEYSHERVPEGEIHVPVVEEEVYIERKPIVREVMVISQLPMNLQRKPPEEEGGEEQHRAA